MCRGRMLHPLRQQMQEFNRLLQWKVQEKPRSRIVLLNILHQVLDDVDNGCDAEYF